MDLIELRDDRGKYIGHISNLPHGAPLFGFSGTFLLFSRGNPRSAASPTLMRQKNCASRFRLQNILCPQKFLYKTGPHKSPATHNSPARTTPITTKFSRKKLPHPISFPFLALGIRYFIFKRASSTPAKEATRHLRTEKKSLYA